MCGRCRGFVSLISIHAPHEGERLFCGLAGVQSAQKFQSTLPTRGSDFHYCRRPRNQAIFQSTLPTRGSDIKFFNICGYPSISIHAPHEGERHAPGAYRLDIINISIHAPHEGERPKYKDHPAVAMLFQSTLPTRGSDLLPVAAIGIDLHFNPRSPRGGATAVLIVHARGGFISIHAPHEGERQKPPFRLLR